MILSKVEPSVAFRELAKLATLSFTVQGWSGRVAVISLRAGDETDQQPPFDIPRGCLGRHLICFAMTRGLVSLDEKLLAQVRRICPTWDAMGAVFKMLLPHHTLKEAITLAMRVAVNHDDGDYSAACAFLREAARVEGERENESLRNALPEFEPTHG